MNANGRQQAYDRGHTIFSPDGRLYQVEYARKAVERGSPSVGVLTDGGAVLAARKRLQSSLLDPESVEKVHRVDDHVAVASAGHAADARRLVEHARVASQRHRVHYGEPIPVESLTTAVADHVQEYTQSGGSRPFGTALLVAGVDPAAAGGDGGRPQLFEVDPSGTPYGWRAVAIGDGATEIRRHFEERFAGGDVNGDSVEYDDNSIDLDMGLTEALTALQTASGESLTPDALDVWSIDSEPIEITPLSADEIGTALETAAS